MRLVRRRAYISRPTVLLPTFSQEYNRQLLTRQKAQAGDLAKLRQKVLSRAMRKYLRGEDDVVRRSSDAQVDVRGKLNARLFEILKYVMARHIYITKIAGSSSLNFKIYQDIYYPLQTSISGFRNLDHSILRRTYLRQKIARIKDSTVQYPGFHPIDLLSISIAFDEPFLRDTRHHLPPVELKTHYLYF